LELLMFSAFWPGDPAVLQRSQTGCWLRACPSDWISCLRTILSQSDV